MGKRHGGPLLLSTDITYSCPFRCIHCFNFSGEKKLDKELADEELMKVAKMVVDVQPTNYCFCGGEPLMRKDILFKMASYMREKLGQSTFINMVSNGWLIDEPIVENLKKCQFDMIQLSLDGPTAEMHDWIRNQKGSFEKVINAIKLLTNAGLKVSISSLPHKKHLSCIEETIELCEMLGVSDFRVQPLMPLGRAKVNLRELEVNYAEYRKLAQMLQKKQFENISRNTMQISWGDPLDHLYRFLDLHIETPNININAFGGIMISPYIPLEFGNVRKHSLMEYWEKGLANVWKLPIVKQIIEQISGMASLDISKLNNIPQIYKEKNISLDLIENSWESLEKLVL